MNNLRNRHNRLQKNTSPQSFKTWDKLDNTQDQEYSKANENISTQIQELNKDQWLQDTHQSIDEEEDSKFTIQIKNRIIIVDFEDLDSIYQCLRKIRKCKSVEKKCRLSIEMIVLDRAKSWKHLLFPLFQKTVQKYQHECMKNIFN